MFTFLQIAQLFSSLSFMVYGSSCLFSETMKIEFKRYQASELRVLTGVLQILASLSLLAGLIYPILSLPGSLGLCLMMMGALFVRFKIKDPLISSLPAFVYMLLNGFLFWQRLSSFT